jgi:2-keto-3-deoxy-6-phosphogluconate aldolase
MKELWEVTMKGNRLFRIFFSQDFGGPPFIRMLRSFVRPVMFVSESGIHPEETRFL